MLSVLFTHLHLHLTQRNNTLSGHLRRNIISFRIFCQAMIRAAFCISDSDWRFQTK